MANPLQPKLLNALKNKGWIAFSLNATGYGMRGLPDIIALKQGVTIFFEIKYGKDRLSKLQEYRIEQLRENNFPVIIVTNDNIKKIIEGVSNNG